MFNQIKNYLRKIIDNWYYKCLSIIQKTQTYRNSINWQKQQFN